MTCVTPVAYSYEEHPKNAPDVYSLIRNRKYIKVGDEPSGTMKYLVMVAKTYRVLKMFLGTIPEAEGTGSESVKQDEVPPT